MKITIVKFEKAVAVQFAGMIEELGGERVIFYREGFDLKSIGEASIQWDALCFPGENTPDDTAVHCGSFGSNKDRDKWFTKCTNCLKAWKESRQSRETSSPDVWTIDVD